jgi:uncharacterized membrane protein YfcA
VVISGVLFTGAYEYGSTASIIGVYIVFAIGLYYFNKRSSNHSINSIYNGRSLSDKETKRKKIEQVCGNWGVIIGIGGGLFGLIIGLINNGQLIL